MPQNYDRPLTGIGTPTQQRQALGYIPARAAVGSGGISVDGGPSGPVISVDSSLVLDDISDIQGSVLYRGASVWEALGPGTSGYVLKTLGPAANPAWQVDSAGTGTVTTTGSPLIGQLTMFSSPTSITNGNLTGDVTTGGSLATTLKTVNSNVGTFGDASNIAQFTVNAKGLITGASNVPISLPAGANPSASVGLAAVNGVATTFLRSDAAPALSQAIVPTWTGAHQWTPAVGVTPLKVNAAIQTANVPVLDLTQTWNNSGVTFTGYKFNITNTASAFASLIADWQIGGVSKAYIRSDGSILSVASIQTGAEFVVGATGRLNCNGDTYLQRRAAANWQLGFQDAVAPVAQTLSTQGSRSSTDTNVSGGNLTIQAGRGTGNAAGSTLNLQTPVPVTSGTGAQTQTTGLQILYGVAKLSSYTVATLPLAATVGNGCEAFVTDSTLPYLAANIGTPVIGGGANGTRVTTIAAAWVIG